MSPKQPFIDRKGYKDNYSKELQAFLEKAEKEALEIPVTQITPSVFIILALNDENTMLYKTLNLLVDTKTINTIYNEVYSIISKSLTPLKPNRKIGLSPEMINIIKKTDLIRKENKHDLISTDHVLLGILHENKYIEEIFEKNDVSFEELLVSLNEMHNITTMLNENDKNLNIVNIDEILSNDSEVVSFLQSTIGITPNNTKNNKNGEISYCTNLNKLTEIGKIDKIYGRDDKINEIIQILNRRKNNNVVIVGDSGVGKSSLIDGFVANIVNNIVPPNMNDKIVWKLNITSLIAGTQFRGMVEERISTITSLLKKNKNNILFIDDAHTIVNQNKNNDYDLMGMLNEILSDNDVKVILTTNFSGYKSLFEKSNSYSSKFQKIILEKPSKEECFNILMSIKHLYEKHHKVKYDENIIKLCVSLSERYNTDKTLPTSAIDLMDQVGSYCFLNNTFSIDNKELSKLKQELKEELKNSLKKDDIDNVVKIENQIENISTNIAKLNKNSWIKTENGINVSEDDVYTIISNNTGIPISKINSNDNKLFKNFDKLLRKDIIGQDDAINKVTKAIKRGKVGLNKKNKPIASFMFIGESGVGKTYLAKKIAETIFGDEKYLVRLDMSEYSDKTSINKLIGTGSGYVGYENGGLLTEAVKKQKYCVLLIDEIEKANEEIYNTFLQILDEGVLTDNSGKKVDFKNTVIIMTSNIGTKNAALNKTIDFNETNTDNRKKEIIEKELKDKFPPEFLNRFDDIIYFNKLTNDVLKAITSIEIEKLGKSMEKEGYALKTHENIIEWIVNKVNANENFGARPILRIIQNEIENNIIDLIFDDDNKKEFFVEIKNNELIIS